MSRADCEGPASMDEVPSPEVVASLVAACPRIPPAELARIRRIRAMRNHDAARKAN